MTLNRVYISEKDCMLIVRVLKNNTRTWVSSLGPFWGSEPRLWWFSFSTFERHRKKLKSNVTWKTSFQKDILEKKNLKWMTGQITLNLMIILTQQIVQIVVTIAEKRSRDFKPSSNVQVRNHFILIFLIDLLTFEKIPRELSIAWSNFATGSPKTVRVPMNQKFSGYTGR